MSNGIGKNPLNDISKAYLESVAESAVPGKPAEKLGAVTAIPKSEQEAAKERLLAKAKAKREKLKMKEALDPVGQEDKDIDNDNDVDNTDEYLHKRRKAIRKAMKKRMKNEEVEVAEAKNGGDNDPCWDSHKQVGMKKKGKRMVPNCVPKTKTESFSNWRSELTEVAPMKDEDEKEIKEKKVNNKVTINPKLGEEVVSEMGGTLLEMVELEEIDTIVASVYDELIEEGYTEDEVENGIETALTTLEEGYYDSAVEASKASAEKNSKETPKKSMKDRLKSAAKNVIVGTARVAGKVMKAKAEKPGQARAKVKSVIDRVRAAAKTGYEQGRGPVEKKTTYRGSGVGRKEKIGEEAEVDPKEKQMLAKKKTMMMKQQMLDKQRMQMQQQGKLPSGHRSA